MIFGASLRLWGKIRSGLCLPVHFQKQVRTLLFDQPERVKDSF